MNRTIRHAAIAAVTLAATVTIAACSGSTDHQNMPAMNAGSTPTVTSATAATPASGSHNAADVTFASGMIPHHGQAITMADMATKQATNSQVKSLAAAIKTAQGPEIATMSGWLTGWGQPVPAATGGHDMSGMGTGTVMSGMMSEQDMQQLSAATGAAFDRVWLQMMIKHHQGAVAMAQTELSNGQATDAKQLAQQIIEAQNKEIDTMTALLPTITG